MSIHRAGIGIVLIACAPTHPESAPSSAAAERESAAAVSLEQVALTPGTSRVTVRSDGSPRELMLLVPRGDTSKRRPLVIFLHGANGANTLDQVAQCLVEPGLAPIAPIILAPVSPSPHWWTGVDARFVLGLVEAAVHAWPVEVRRVVVTGYSDGGIGAWSFIRLYPETFSAAIPIASSHTIMGASSRPVHAIHGEQDELFALSSVREQAELLQGEGSDIVLSVKPQGRHFEPCSYVAELHSAAEWLIQSAWKQRAKNKHRRDVAAPTMGASFSGP